MGEERVHKDPRGEARTPHPSKGRELTLNAIHPCLYTINPLPTDDRRELTQPDAPHT